MRPSLFLLALGLAVLPAAGQEGRFLVLCQDEYLTVVRPLADWRQASGLQTVIVPLSGIGSDSTEFRAFVSNAWHNWPVPPEYLLLVADPEVLPAPYYSSGHGLYHSDGYYGDTEGDYVQELPVGRFPARSVEECELMVTRTLAYETNPPLDDSLWMRRLTTIIREDHDPDDTIYWKDIRVAASLAGQSGFIGCDSLSSIRGHDADSAIASIEAGTGIVLYRGQACSYWYPPFNVDPDLCHSGPMTQVILSFTCSTVSLEPREQMLGGHWFRSGTPDTLNGPVAFVGGTHCGSGVARERSTLTRAFFSGLFTGGLDRLGDAMLHARNELVRHHPADTSDYRGFTVFGDPAVRLWTATPLFLEVDHPHEITPDSHTVEVTVSHIGTPVPGAPVCASMDSTVHVVDTTDANGIALLKVAPTDTGRMRLVVAGANLLPYDSVIFVGVQTAMHERPAVIDHPVSFFARPTASRRSLTLRWSPDIRLGPVAIRIHDAAGRLVSAIRPAATNHVTWNGRDAEDNPVPTGVYYALLEHRGTRSDPVRLTFLP